MIVLLTWWHNVVIVPPPTGEVVEVLTRVHTLVHAGEDGRCQFHAARGHAHIIDCWIAPGALLGGRHSDAKGNRHK